MKLTPEKLAKIYDKLARCSPFSQWNMPPRGLMVFKITKSKKRRGYFRPLYNGMVISISEEHNTTRRQVEATMAHEMIHAHLEMVSPDGPHHGREFQARADEVCEQLHFRRKWF